MSDTKPSFFVAGPRLSRIADRISVLFMEVLGCGAIIVIVSFLVMSNPFIQIIDKYWGEREGGGNNIHEKLALHIAALGKRPEHLPRIAIVGASPLMTGLSSSMVNRVFQDNGINAVVHNNGIPHFSAYELPIFGRDFLTPGTKAVVFLYNSFSFGDEIIPEMNYFRWNTFEMLHLQNPSWLSHKTWTDNWFGRFVHEHLAIVRYHEFFRYLLVLSMTSTLVELSNEDEIPDIIGGPHPVTFEPFPVGYPFYVYQRRRVAAGGHMVDTLGYRGLIRFCEMAKNAGVRLFLVPMPEAEFSRYMGAQAFRDNDFLDLRVRQIGEGCGATVIPRSYSVDVSANEKYWGDYIHGNKLGRDVFSVLLGHELVKYLSN